MNLKIIPLVLLMSIFGMPGIAQAKDIDVQSGNIRINKDRNGNIYINTGNNRLRVPANRSYVDVNSFRQYPRINGCNRGNQTRQEITQIRRTNNSVIQSHVSTHQCN